MAVSEFSDTAILSFDKPCLIFRGVKHVMIPVSDIFAFRLEEVVLRNYGYIHRKTVPFLVDHERRNCHKHQ